MYKLVGILEGGNWVPALKLSESADKVPIPGQKNIWRLYDQRGKATADLVALLDEDPRTMEGIHMVHPVDPAKRRIVRQDEIAEFEPLLVDVLQEGRPVYDMPPIEAIRDQRIADMERLDPGVRRLLNPHIYHVSLTARLSTLKQDLIDSAHRSR